MKLTNMCVRYAMMNRQAEAEAHINPFGMLKTLIRI